MENSLGSAACSGQLVGESLVSGCLSTRDAGERWLGLLGVSLRCSAMVECCNLLLSMHSPVNRNAGKLSRDAVRRRLMCGHGAQAGEAELKWRLRNKSRAIVSIILSPRRAKRQSHGSYHMIPPTRRFKAFQSNVMAIAIRASPKVTLLSTGGRFLLQLAVITSQLVITRVRSARGSLKPHAS